MASYLMKGASASGPASLVYTSIADESSSYDRYPKKLSAALGTLQILFGVLCIIFNSVSLAFLDTLQHRGSGIIYRGIWSGTLFFITGVVGIAAGMKKQKCEIVANLVMCIISASFTFFLVLDGVSGAFETNSQRSLYCSLQVTADVEICIRSVSVVVAMESCLAIAGVIEAALFIWGSVLGCKSGACCCSGSYQQMTPSPEYVQLMEDKHCDVPPPTYKEEED